MHLCEGLSTNGKPQSEQVLAVTATRGREFQMQRDPAWPSNTWSEWRSLFWWFRNRPSTIKDIPQDLVERIGPQKARLWLANMEVLHLDWLKDASYWTLRKYR